MRYLKKRLAVGIFLCMGLTGAPGISPSSGYPPERQVWAIHDPEHGVYRYGSGEKMEIALTFDDGPHATRTPEILDLLAAEDVPATFFVIGVNAEAHPELVKREAAEGHEIGLHTYTHPRLCKCKKESLDAELADCEALFTPLLGGKTPKLFRPPGGECGSTVKEVAAAHGYAVILWSVDTRDWAHTSTEKIEREVLKNVRPGSIILMHDYITGDAHTLEALRVLIPALRERGYRFVTVSELLGI